MGCDTVQGFIFAAPMFEEEFLAWTATSRGRASKSVA
jgi:EAL domain-containing protein (putative c-di-GMP-specific phosphodiesterase class I)